jgi:archaellum component FlaC
LDIDDSQVGDAYSVIILNQYTMDTTTQPTDQQTQINAWKEEVREVKEEVAQMRGRLEQIARSAAPADVMSRVEHFENRILRQREVADEMFHDIKQCAKCLSDAPSFVRHDDRPVDDYNTMQDRMETFQKLYTELKSDFNQFMSAHG